MLRANTARLLYNLVARVIPNILYLVTPPRKEVLNVNKLFVGLDLSLKDYKVSIIDQNGVEVVKPFSVTNDQNGADILIDTILRCCKALAVDTLFIGLESTSVYGWHIQHLLADSPQLKPYHPHIICFNPKLIENFKKSLGNLPKNDWVDANTIAERLRFGRLPKSCSVDFRYLALQRLTRYRYHLVENLAREKSYYLSNLFLKFSAICQDKVFSNNFGASATELFHEFLTVEDIATRSLDELIDFIMEHGKKHFECPQATAKALKETAAKSYRLNASVDNSLSFVLKSCLENIKALEKQIKAVDKAIEKELPLFKNEFLCLTSVKGIGPVLAAGLISEIGGISRFENDNALAKFSGLYWSEYQSGDFTADDTFIRKTGNHYLRYYFIQAAEQLRKYLPEFADYYSRKYNESKTHHHKRALVLTARKAVRLVFALLRDEKLYNPSARKGDISIS